MFSNTRISNRTISAKASPIFFMPKKDERKELYFYCDSSLRDIIKIFEPEYVIGIGNFAEQRAVEALTGINLTVRKILHPSPASPQSNKNWGEKVKIQLQELNLI